MCIRAFRHIIKSSSAAGRTRCWFGNTITCPAADDSFGICQKRTYGFVLVFPSRRLVRPAVDDAFVMW